MDDMNGKRLLDKRTWVLVVVAELAAVALILGVKVLDGLDFEVYRLGTAAWLHGDDPYGGLPPTSRGFVLPFTYPPFAVLAFVPTALVPARAGFLVLTAISVILLFAVVFAFVVALRGREKGLVVPAFVAIGVQVLAAATDPVRSTLGYGQINMVLMALVAVDCLARRPRWPRGVLVGLAAAIKLTPAVFVLFFLLRKDYRAAMWSGVSFLAATALAFVLLPGPSVQYWTKLVFVGDRIGPPFFVANQSLRGAFARLAHETWWVAPAVVVVALTVYVVPRVRLPLALAVTALCGLLVSPVSWIHHWVWLVPILVVLGWIAVTERRVVIGLSVLFALAVAVVTPVWRYEKGGWDAGPVQQLTSDAYVLAGIILLGVTAVYASGRSTRMSRPPARGAPAAMDPSWALTTDRTIDSPSPEPPPVAVRSSRRKGSNNPASSAVGTTGPVFTTRNAGDPPTDTDTDPPGRL
ncbi:alpha-1,2-mannosyltransferase [Actinocrispum wychmicini]|uniref:Alpha-1,2-mannosyltransferase n=1 Tax=Actinocrispum wychmicini TaxID=1213861 RepID=A0A4R2JIC5_9PSEU|nr:alpha-1,2-mannosyltransferase [Actinocrispum wychmicini]